ncbi:SPOR domain-containing protein [Agromyces aurantiacus]|uniref:SPOR domain-containing protein n=1 Tax=Agromyces aurantiacus TaxID=165814 RepID=A0ABV9R599_9MICO|nr:hypothetical protein [Agromyces aurantiacus]MBM7503465.1 outer membrane biosynthesis protein TonB [Agromyces aurantiacus]
MNTRIRGALRRAGRPHGPHPEDDATTVRRSWRTTLAATAVAALALAGVTAIAGPAAAEEVADPAAVQSTQPAQDQATDPTTPAEQPVAEEPAAEPSTPVEEPAAEVPAEQPADAPAEAAPPADPPAEEAAPPAEEAEVPAEAAEVATDAPKAAAAKDVQTQLVPPGEEPVDKVTLCHRTGSYSNPYVVITPAANSVVGGQPSAVGHGEEHMGPIFYPEIPKHTEWGDIVPSFYYEEDGQVQFFPGLNWDSEGQLVYENDCMIEIPTPEVELEYETCVYYTPPFLTVYLYGLMENLDYRLTVENQDGVVDVQMISDTEGDTSFTWDPIPGGDYTVTLEQSFSGGEWEVVDEQMFTVEDCPVLDVTATGKGCITGQNGEGLVSISGMIVDEDYDWTLTGPGAPVSDTLTAPSESLDVPFGNLPPGDYEFMITWTGDDSITASAAFTVEPCPPAPPKPPAPPAPHVPSAPTGLAETGAAGTGGLLTAAMILLGLGGAALVARRIRTALARAEE